MKSRVSALTSWNLIAAISLAALLAGIIGFRKGLYSLSPKSDQTLAGSKSTPACGHWCVYRCARLSGIDVKMEDVFKVLSPASEHSLLEIQGALRKLGLVAEAQKMKLSDALRDEALAVCHFPSQEHFVVAVRDGKGATMFYDDNRIVRLGAQTAEKVIGNVVLAVSKPKQSLQMIVSQRANQAEHAPLIQLDSLHQDLGSVTGDGTYSATFQVSNVGKQPLMIQNVQTDCTCLATDVSNNTVLPGQKQTIRLTFQPETREYRKEFLHYAAITSNDSTMPLVTVGVSGVIKDATFHLPNIVDFGEVWWGNPRSKEFFVQYFKENAGDQLDQFAVSSSLPEVNCRMAMSEKEQSAFNERESVQVRNDRRSQKFEATWSPTTPVESANNLNGTFEIHVKPGSNPHIVPFRGRAVPPFVVINRAIQVSPDQSGGVSGEIEIRPRSGVRLEKSSILKNEQSIHAELRSEPSGYLVLAVHSSHSESFSITGASILIAIQLANTATGETRESEVRLQVFSDVQGML